MKRILLESIIRVYQCMRATKAFAKYLFAMVILLAIAMSACSIDVRMGRRPDVQELEKNLRLQESTSRDVLAALGDPFGKGKAMLPGFHSTPKIMWSYYYGEANLKDARNMYLFVFFDQDRYDGYMWFSSLVNESPNPPPTQQKQAEPKVAQFYNDRGVAYFSKGQYEQAILDFNKAIETNPSYAEAYDNRGCAYVAKGQYDHAISDFNTVLEMNPRLAMAYSNRGTAYMNKGQYDQAISDHTKAVEISPQFAGAYYGRAMVFEKKNQYDQAISDFNKVLEVDPKHASAYYRRGRSYYFKKEYDKSWDDIKSAQDLGYKIPAEFLDDLRKASGREK